MRPQRIRRPKTKIGVYNIVSYGYRRIGGDEKYWHSLINRRQKQNGELIQPQRNYTTHLRSNMSTLKKRWGTEILEQMTPRKRIIIKRWAPNRWTRNLRGRMVSWDIPEKIGDNTIGTNGVLKRKSKKFWRWSRKNLILKVELEVTKNLQDPCGTLAYNTSIRSN